ncbi:MAG: hypothetical protein ACK5MJ_07695 [Alphaproteobacteria bacterium]
MASQIPLDLSFEPSYRKEDYIINTQNKAIMQLYELWPCWNNPWILIEGEEGAGKTHLGHIFAEKMQAKMITDFDFNLYDILDSNQPLIVDVALPENAEHQDMLFHMINHVKESQQYGVFLTEPIDKLNFTLLADLHSRLRQMLSFRLEILDEHTLEALLVKLFSDRQLSLSLPQIKWLVPRVRRTYAFLRSYVAQVDKVSLASKEKITIKLLKQELENILRK